jgi:hypothetical protein
MSTTRTRTVLAVLVGGLAVLGAGTAAGALGSDAPAPAPVVTAVVPAADPAPLAAAADPAPVAGDPAGLSADDAGRRAVAHLGGGTAVKVESEVEHGRQEWKVDVARAGRTDRVRLDALTGTVTRVDARASSGRGSDDGGRGRGRGSDDGPGHDAFDDHGGDR